MKFRISNNAYTSTSKPCENTVIERYDKVERFYGPEEIYNYGKEPQYFWKAQGTQHKSFEENGINGIQRILPDRYDAYFIEINTLEEFINLFDNELKGEHYEIIITKETDECSPADYVIEIDDNYGW